MEKDWTPRLTGDNFPTISVFNKTVCEKEGTYTEQDIRKWLEPYRYGQQIGISVQLEVDYDTGEDGLEEIDIPFIAKPGCFYYIEAIYPGLPSKPSYPIMANFSLEQMHKGTLNTLQEMASFTFDYRTKYERTYYIIYSTCPESKIIKKLNKIGYKYNGVYKLGFPMYSISRQGSPAYHMVKMESGQKRARWHSDDVTEKLVKYLPDVEVFIDRCSIDGDEVSI